MIKNFNSLQIGDKVRIHWLDHVEGATSIVTIKSERIISDGNQNVYKVQCEKCTEGKCWHRITKRNFIEAIEE